jgi:hypothetical protein
LSTKENMLAALSDTNTYSETSISGPRYPDLFDIRTEFCPDIEYRGCVINKENVPIILGGPYRVAVRLH